MTKWNTLSLFLFLSRSI